MLRSLVRKDKWYVSGNGKSSSQDKCSVVTESADEHPISALTAAQPCLYGIGMSKGLERSGG